MENNKLCLLYYKNSKSLKVLINGHEIHNIAELKDLEIPSNLNEKGCVTLKILIDEIEILHER